jgi:hypothetical protein
MVVETDRFRAGADTLNISLAARPQLGALQKAPAKRKRVCAGF